jgi:hypothetical protein
MESSGSDENCGAMSEENVEVVRKALNALMRGELSREAVAGLAIRSSAGTTSGRCLS